MKGVERCPTVSKVMEIRLRRLGDQPNWNTEDQSRGINAESVVIVDRGIERRDSRA